MLLPRFLTRMEPCHHFVSCKQADLLVQLELQRLSASKTRERVNLTNLGVCEATSYRHKTRSEQAFRVDGTNEMLHVWREAEWYDVRRVDRWRLLIDRRES